MEVRAAASMDAAAIGAIYAACWRDAYPGLVPDRVLLGMTPASQEVNWAAALRQDGGRGFVQVAADAGGAVVGFGSCGSCRAGSLGYDGEVFTLYVHPDQRDVGHGRNLLRGLFLRLSEDGRRGAVVWVLAGNPARHFYGRVGGRIVARRTERMWGAELPQVAYGWPDLAVALAAP